MQHSKNITVLRLLWIKEGIHWNRMSILWKIVGKDVGARFISYPIMVVLVSLSHYAFAGMHTLLDIYLFFFKRNILRKNVMFIYKKTINVAISVRRQKRLIYNDKRRKQRFGLLES